MSFFRYNSTTGYRELNLRQLWGNLSANPTEEVNLLPHDYLLALGTRNESTTKDNTWVIKENVKFSEIPTSAINVTGEGHLTNNLEKLAIRGSIVVGTNLNRLVTAKGSKSRVTLSRAYSTSSKNSNSLQSLTNENCENNLGFERIARL